MSQLGCRTPVFDGTRHGERSRPLSGTIRYTEARPRMQRDSKRAAVRHSLAHRVSLSDRSHRRYTRMAYLLDLTIWSIGCSCVNIRTNMYDFPASGHDVRRLDVSWQPGVEPWVAKLSSRNRAYPSLPRPSQTRREVDVCSETGSEHRREQGRVRDARRRAPRQWRCTIDGDSRLHSQIRTVRLAPAVGAAPRERGPQDRHRSPARHDHAAAVRWSARVRQLREPWSSGRPCPPGGVRADSIHFHLRCGERTPRAHVVGGVPQVARHRRSRRRGCAEHRYGVLAQRIGR